MALRLGLLGGSFNPIHFGHLIPARAIAERLTLDRILLIPANIPPHKQDRALAPAEHRLAMARRAVADDPLFEVCDIELRRDGPSYTFDTVAAVRAAHPDIAALYWIIGGDTLPELTTWYRISELVQQVQFVTAARPGAAGQALEPLRACVGDAAFDALLAHRLETPRIEISATDIRARVTAGRSIRYLTPDAVGEYIATHGLFRGGAV